MKLDGCGLNQLIKIAFTKGNKELKTIKIVKIKKIKKKY